MNRTTLIFVAVAAILGVVAFVVTREDAPPEATSFQADGYATQAQLDREAKQGLTESSLPIDYPIDEVVITKGGETVRAKVVRYTVKARGAKGKVGEIFTQKDCAGTALVSGTFDASGELTHEMSFEAWANEAFWAKEAEGSCRTASKDVEWKLVEPIAWAAARFPLETIIREFKTTTASAVSKSVKPEKLSRYHLDAERRVGVTLKMKGAVWNGVDLVVGKVEKGDPPPGQRGEATNDTWVLLAGDETTAYRLAGKDLRSGLDVDLDTLRDKKVSTLEAQDVQSIVVAAPDGAKVSLERKDADSWELLEPTGFTVDNTAADGLARALSNLRAKAFVTAKEAPAGAIGDAPWVVTASGGEATFEVKIGAAKVDDAMWAQVAGSDELLKLDDYAASGLKKTVGDLRDKQVVSVEAEQVTRVQLTGDAGERIVVERKGSGWAFVEPAKAFGADLGSQLGSMVKVKAERYAAATESEAAAKALATPAISAGLSVADKTWQLAFGAKIEEGDNQRKRWAQVTLPDGTKTEPFLVGDYVATRYQKKLDDLRAKKLFDFKSSDVQRIEVVWPDGKTVVTVERAPEASVGLIPVPLPKGKKPKTAAMTSMEGSLSNMRAKAFFDAKQPAEVELVPATAFVVTATLADGRTVKLLIAKDKKEGTDPYATADSGPLAGQVFTLNTYQVDHLTKKLEDLVE